MTNPQSYEAIKGFFDRTPQELCAKGNEMAFSPTITELARRVTGLAVKDIVISDESIDNYTSVGPAVVVPNHRSLFDLTAMGTLGVVTGEGQPWFMSKVENMDTRLKARFYGRMRTFPIDRDMSDRRWLTVFAKWGEHILGTDEHKGQQSSKLVIFGEGTREVGPRVKEMHRGPLLMAKKNNVPIIPVGIAGTDQLSFRSGRPIVAVEVGEPYDVVSFRDRDLLRTEVQKMLDIATLRLSL